jgi:hypothetical protein
MDFAAPQRLRPRMDPKTADLIAQLCTHVGMIMEDVSPVALAISNSASHERANTLAELSQAVKQMERLISAAVALNG